MPTQSTTYNSRVTDEALEKRFRDTFRAQGGSELVDDLYAQGVIVPIVDFTAAATGQQLAENLQTAWDFGTGYASVSPSSTGTTIVSTSGFWKVGVSLTLSFAGTTIGSYNLFIDDGSTQKIIYSIVDPFSATVSEQFAVPTHDLTVFLRAGDTLKATTAASGNLQIVYRQIATVNGDLVNPTGFTSS